MKSIDRKDFINAGSVVKTHGTKGELKLSFDREFKLKEWAFLEIQGKPVPFYIESIQLLQGNEAIVKLEDMNTMEQAEYYTGVEVLLIKSKSKSRKGKQVDDGIVGYQLIDQAEGVIGELRELRELPGQLMFVVMKENEDEILIPAVDEFILGIDDDSQVINLNLPEGFLDI